MRQLEDRLDREEPWLAAITLRVREAVLGMTGGGAASVVRGRAAGGLGGGGVDVSEDRLAALETALALVLLYLDEVGRYDRYGNAIDYSVPAVEQARAVLGEEAFRRVVEG